MVSRKGWLGISHMAYPYHVAITRSDKSTTKSDLAQRAWRRPARC
jgi:hypothetical protein